MRGLLASVVQGLGQLTALTMSISGDWLFTGKIPNGLVLERLKAIANLMWIFVISHAGLAVFQQILSHHVLQRRFSSSPSMQFDSSPG
ncbi:MAG: hypothetical protein HHJ16_10070 [Polaromonas sp.]|uniref:hypothetical protein n=1 Tax=Polaromonas sp. TaxID=1869339 RepID=UPI0017D72F88|nr:hypothetical protein [Polaromonas sp.]NMM10607.1 hypothetical protein [Polaromonas sp.]